MKFGCGVDGVHFANEYEQTLKPPCNFWGDLGMSNMPEDLKKKFWDWLFSMPTDEIGLKSSIGIAIQISTAPIKPEDRLENKIVGYNELSDSERQMFQKEYFLRLRKGKNVEQWIKKINKSKMLVDDSRN